MHSGTAFERNYLLRSLTPDLRARCCPLMEPVELPLSRVLHESGCPMSRKLPRQVDKCARFCIAENPSPSLAATLSRATHGDCR